MFSIYVCALARSILALHTLLFIGKKDEAEKKEDEKKKDDKKDDKADAKKDDKKDKKWSVWRYRQNFFY